MASRLIANVFSSVLRGMPVSVSLSSSVALLYADDLRVSLLEQESLRCGGAASDWKKEKPCRSRACRNRKCLFCDRGQLGWVDVDEAAVLALVLEADDARDHSEEGVVLAAADVGAGLQRGSALPDDDATGENGLAA